ncbi:MAG: hypothetical protein FJ104_13450, partial [Deltaproteobacteria bacterium]|nr:hypothetical protein [Deltaproteobacteria bacterium]
RLAAVAAVLAAATLFEPPSADDYRLGPGDWSHPRLAGLRFHPPDYPYPTEKDRLQGGADAAIDDAARFLDGLTSDGEEVLLLGPMQILVLASGTRAWGGRHVHDLWLLDRGVLSAQAFREIVPPSFFERLRADPPRVVVGELRERHLVEALPELAEVLGSGRYRMVGTRFRYLFFVLNEPPG